MFISSPSEPCFPLCPLGLVPRPSPGRPLFNIKGFFFPLDSTEFQDGMEI